ncbi:RAMP superfamily CRISPR-associated protein [Rhodobacter lacus]|uniref:RAMP superfamily CRISPR-associated protein n=1 Tax=Rhodobacter lacus TaxID=1641972 RepID=A0ABW5A7Q2_9RHOB
MKRFHARLCLTLRSPFIFPDSEAVIPGIDLVAHRNRAGLPFVPRDQLKGVFRDAVAKSLRAGAPGLTVDDIFGAASSDDGMSGSFAPRPGVVLFSDAIAADFEGLAPVITHRVEIDAETGAAKEAHLLFVELVAPRKKTVRFEADVVWFCKDLSVGKALRRAKSWISAIGAMKSAGFGEVVDIQISDETVVDLTELSHQAPPAERTRYVFSFDRPYLVDARIAADNVLVGQSTVPGAVIKGALARKLDLAGVLSKFSNALTDLSISHARPEDAQEILPLSVVRSLGTGEVFDLWQCAQPYSRDIEFQIDWKNEASESVKREVRVHTAVTEDTEIAETGNLFLIDAIDPVDGRFVVDVDYGRIPAEEREILHAMLIDGLHGIGRTGAIATVHDCFAVLATRDPLRGSLFAVSLATDAILASPVDDVETGAAYQDYWSRVLHPHTVELVDFYASQRIVGGYLSKRYRSGAAQEYRPWCVTIAGSTFLLRGDDLGQALSDLRDSRLPPPFIDGVPLRWDSCPFQPENGFGEIKVTAVNPREDLRHD